jgi:hypothetical protein
VKWESQIIPDLPTELQKSKVTNPRRFAKGGWQKALKPPGKLAARRWRNSKFEARNSNIVWQDLHVML